MKLKLTNLLLAACLLLCFAQCKGKKDAVTEEPTLSDEALMDTVQRLTFNYFWDGAEPNSGLARERIHMDGIYPENDQNVVTTGGSGFGIMAVLAGIDRGYVTREEGLARMEKIVSFLERADRFHGVYPHWWYGDTGKVARSVAAGHDGVHKVHANLRELGNKDGKTYAQDISEFPGRNKKSHK